MEEIMDENGEMMQVQDNILSPQSKSMKFITLNSREVLHCRLHNKQFSLQHYLFIYLQGRA